MMSGVVDKVSTDGQSLSPTPKTPLETELCEALENLQNQVHQIELEKAELPDQHSQEVECLVEKKALSLQRRVQEQAALLDVATDAIFVRDLDGNILDWNKGAETLYGWAAEEALEKKASKLMYPDGANNDGEIYKNLLRQGSWKGERSQVR